MKSFKEILESYESDYDLVEAIVGNAERLGIDSNEFVIDIIEEFYSENYESEVLKEFLGTAAAVGAGALGANYLNNRRNADPIQLMQQLQQSISQNPDLQRQLGHKLSGINQMLVQARSQNQQPSFARKMGSALGQVKNWWNNLGQEQGQNQGQGQMSQPQPADAQQGSSSDAMMDRWNQFKNKNTAPDPNSMTGRLSQWQKQQSARRNNTSVYA